MQTIKGIVVDRNLDPLLNNTLGNYNIEPISTSSNNETLEIINTAHIDFVLVNIDMQIDPFSFAQDLQNANQEIQIIAISNKKHFNEIIKLLNFGFSGFIQRPINLQELNQVLQKTISSIQKNHLIAEQKTEINTLKEIINVNSAVCMTDKDGKIIFANDNYLKATGYLTHDLIDNTHKIMRHPTTSKEQIKELWTILNSGQIYKGIFKNLSKQGKTILIDSIIAPLKDSNNDILGYMSVGYDITKQHQAEQLKKQQYSWLIELINFTPNMFLMTDGTKIDFANKALLNFFGFESLKDLQTHKEPFFEYFIAKPDGISPNKRWIDNARDLIAKGETPKAYFYNAIKDTVEIFDVFLTTTRIDTITMVAFFNITRFEQEKSQLQDKNSNDLWELIDNQSTLYNHKMLFEYAINSTSDGYYEFDISNKQIHITTKWQEMLGFDSNILEYSKFLDLIIDNEIKEKMNCFEYLLNLAINEANQGEKSSPFRIQYQIMLNNGNTMLIEDSGAVLFNDTNKPYKVVGFHKDITEQKRKDDLLFAQSRLAAIGEMITNIAHQWRQPLGSINNILNDLIFEIQIDELENIQSTKIIQTANDIQVLTDYLTKTIDDFRHFGNTEQNKQNFNINAQITEALNIAKSSYSHNNIKLNFIEDNKDIHVNGIKRELTQVILNILNNAKDVIHERDIKNAEVTLKLFCKNETVYITITDNAGGIPKDVLKKIFDPYFTTKHESVGTGLGLYTSKIIIEKHFNGLLIASSDESGATFTISMPLVK